MGKVKALLVLCHIAVVALPLLAQNYGEITGSVADSSGAVVAGASVTVTNTGTNATRQVQTSATGNYSLPFLVPGFYNVRVEQAGFKTDSRTGLNLQVGAVARIDFGLTVGSVSETVEVSSIGALLATEGTAVGTVIENKRIVELPLNGRNYLQLVGLAPNVTSETPTAGSAASKQGGDRVQQNFSIAGQRVQMNHYTLDGIENTDANYNTFIFRPSIDALQEFKVETGVYSAEFGRNPGQINVTTRSGSNQLHGSAFEFLRNSALDAELWRQAGKKNPFRRNQYGFTVGGKIVPDRLFFMSNFEGLKDRTTLQEVASVATDRMRSGDFSGQPRGIFDPLSRTFRTDSNGNPVALSAVPFANNTIPASRFSPIGLKLFEFYPRATTPGDSISRNYVNPSSSLINLNQYTQRIDFNENSKSFWFGRFGWDSEFSQPDATFPNQASRFTTKAYQALLANTRTFTPTVVNEFRFGYTQFQNITGTHWAGIRNVTAELGIKGVNADAGPSAWGTPNIAFSNGLTGFGDSNDGPYVNKNHYFQWIDNMSIVKGSHSIRFGGELRRERVNSDGNVFSSRPTFGFNQNIATNDPANRLTTGYSFADYMLGFSSQVDFAPGIARLLFRSTSFAFYGEDVWKVSSKLTVNYGLRYEFTPPYKDKYRGDINAVFSDPGVGPDGLLAGTKTPALIRPGSGDFYEGMSFHFDDSIPIFTGADVSKFGVGSALVKSDYKNFAPRIGLAYSLTNKWTIRAGFGMFYAQDTNNPIMFEMGRNVAGRIRIRSDQERPNIPVNDPFVALGGHCSNWSGPCEGAGALIYVVDTNRRTPYVEQWLFNVQRQITNDIVLEVGYLGNEAHRLQRFKQQNVAILKTGPSDTRTLTQRSPWPMFGQFDSKNGIGNSNYNALSAKLTQRFSRGLTYLTSFTWSKSIDYGSALRPADGETTTPINPYDFRQDRGLSSQHVGRRFVSSLLYEIPIGKGKGSGFLNFDGPMGGVADRVLGGWQLGTILTFADGTPRTPSSIGDLTNTGFGSYPDATGISPVPNDRSVKKFWDIGAFSATNPQLVYRYGNTARSILLNPGTSNWDFSAMKNIRIIEGHSLQFRFESFNFSNHPRWNAPSSDVTSPSTFGVIQTARTMRQIQFGLKYSF